MIVTGSITALFVVTHLATFKFGPFYAAPDGIRDIYRLQLEVFSSPVYVGFYLVGDGRDLLPPVARPVERGAVAGRQTMSSGRRGFW